jgi:hypothetical protein
MKLSDNCEENIIIGPNNSGKITKNGKNIWCLVSMELGDNRGKNISIGPNNSGKITKNGKYSMLSKHEIGWQPWEKHYCWPN